MKIPAVFLSLYLTLSTCCALAQQSAQESLSTHYIADSVAAIILPADYAENNSWSIVINDGEPLLKFQTTYVSEQSGSLSIAIYKELFSQDRLRLQCDTLFATLYHPEYHDLLKNEFIANENNSYYTLECRLKDEFYNEQSGFFDIDDGSAIPNYFIFIRRLDEGVLTTMDLWYTHAKDGLEGYRREAETIISSYQLLKK